MERKTEQRNKVDEPLWSGFKLHERVIIVLLELIVPFVRGLVASSVGNALLLILAVLLCAMHPAIGIYVFGGLIAISAIRTFNGRPIFYVITWFWAKYSSDPQFARYMAREGALDRLKVTIPNALLFIAAAGQFFHYWNLRFGGFIAPPATSAWNTFWDWTRFSASWAIDNLLANFGQIFGLDSIDISPVSQDARIAVFAYNIVLVVVVLGSAVQFANILRRGSI